MVCQTFATDWPRFRGPGLQGASPDPILTAWPKNGPVVAWRTNSPYGFSSLAVSDGKVYTLMGGSCVALDAATGARLWSTNLFASTDTTPTVWEGRVYVYGTKLNCLDATNGKGLWTAVPEGMRSAAQSPWVEDGRVFISTSGAKNCLQAYNATNGTLLWKSQTNLCTFGSPVGATIHGVRQIIFPDRFGLVAVAPESGNQLWGYHPQYPFDFDGPSPVVWEDRVFAFVKTAAIRIDLTNGNFHASCVWTNPWAAKSYVENYYTTLTVHEGNVYILDTGGKLSCRRVSDGLANWETEVDYGSIIKVNDYLVLLNHFGGVTLAKATPESYQPIALSTNRMGREYLNSPAYANGRLYVRGVNEIVCFDVRPPSALHLQAARSSDSSRLCLKVCTTNATAISTNRAANISLVWSPDLTIPMSQWMPVASHLVKTNGALACEECITPGSPVRYYSTREKTQ